MQKCVGFFLLKILVTTPHSRRPRPMARTLGDNAVDFVDVQWIPACAGTLQLG
jgi:hypothetical protein